MSNTEADIKAIAMRIERLFARTRVEESSYYVEPCYRPGYDEETGEWDDEMYLVQDGEDVVITKEVPDPDLESIQQLLAQLPDEIRERVLAVVDGAIRQVMKV